MTNEKMNRAPLYGLMAEFDSAQDLVTAARLTTKAGYTVTDAYAPFPVEGLDDALDLAPSRLPLIMFGGGVLGALLGYGMQYYATVVSYPMNIGGRALPSWPGLIPVTIEITILCAVVSGIVALFLATKLPRVYHPVFNHPDFRRASQDGFFLCIRAKDKKFNYPVAEQFLHDLHPKSVAPVLK